MHRKLVLCTLFCLLNASACFIQAPSANNPYDPNCGDADMSQEKSCFALEVREIILRPLTIANSTPVQLSYYFKTTDGCFREKNGAAVTGMACSANPHSSKLANLSKVSPEFSASCPTQGTVGKDGLITPVANAQGGVCKVTAVAAGLYRGGSVSAQLDVTFLDAAAPVLSQSTPASAATGILACSGNPCTAKIVLVFSESMKTSLTQTLTTGIWNGSSFVGVSNTGSTFSWSSTNAANDTLTIQLSWYWFPQNSQVQFTLDATGLQDTSNNQIAANLQQSFTTTATDQNLAVADTGQTTCYGDSASQACANATWPRQDGDYANTPNARSFTGPVQHSTFTNDYTNTDNVTGLVWKACSEGLSDPTCATGSFAPMDWVSAVNQCSALNTTNSGSGYAGKTNWRLPAPAELVTLLSFSGTYYRDASFPGATSSTSWWTSATRAGTAANAHHVSFFNGSGNVAAAKTTSYNVLCVSSPASLSPRAYTEDTGPGAWTVITDTATKLRWQKCRMGLTGANCEVGTADPPTTWGAALTSCNGLSLGGLTTWRLPSLSELRTLADLSATVPTIRASVFPANLNVIYWSSTTFPGTNSLAYSLDFNDGHHQANAKNTSYYVRCVTTYP